MDFTKLKYPMFETTFKEKKMLLEAMNHIETGGALVLCSALTRVRSSTNEYNDLKEKIMRSLKSKPYLTQYLLPEPNNALKKYLNNLPEVENIYMRRLLRLIWIHKLLLYTGE